MGNSSVRPAEGPLSHPNWRAAAQGEPLRSVWETPLHSDVRIFGDIREGLGPYALIHALPADQRDPVFILRVRSHLDGGLPSLSKTRLENFTGSSLADEVAALIALELGVRLAAGSATRSLIRDNEWQISGDGARPAFLPRRADGSRVLPNVFGDKNCGPGLLTSYSALPGSVATSLVRAARSYRDALWVAEVEPELAWLLLVSALEVAAVQQQVHRTAPGALLAEVKPDLVARLEPDVAAIVAQAFERELAATRRFLVYASTGALRISGGAWSRSTGTGRVRFTRLFRFHRRCATRQWSWRTRRPRRPSSWRRRELAAFVSRTICRSPSTRSSTSRGGHYFAGGPSSLRLRPQCPRTSSRWRSRWASKPRPDRHGGGTSSR
jgi:hypothetical protein